MTEPFVMPPCFICGQPTDAVQMETIFAPPAPPLTLTIYSHDACASRAPTAKNMTKKSVR